MDLNTEDDVDSEAIVIPESPPMSELQSESQRELLSKLTTSSKKPDKEGRCEIIEEENSCSEPEPWTTNASKNNAEDVLIEDDDDNALDEGLARHKSRPSADFVIDMDVDMYDGIFPSTSANNDTFIEDGEEDDLSFLQDVEKLEETLVVPESSAGISNEKNQLGTMYFGDAECRDGLKLNRTEADRLEEVRLLKRLDPNERIFPDVKANSFHTVAFFLSSNYKPGDDLQPHPPDFQSKWDNEYVPMPCARQNTRLYKVRVQTDATHDINDDRIRYKEERVWMWNRIQGALSVPILFSSDFATALAQYTSVKTELKALKYCIESIMTETERYNFFAKVIPCVQTLCLDLERVVTCPLPLLKKFKNQSLSLSQQQIACLLANAFFSTFPKRFMDEELQYPSINFLELFQCLEDDESNSRLITKAQKIRCVLNYFARIADGMPKGVVTFTRKSVRHASAPKWDTLTKKLSKIIPLLDGTIEDDGVGMLQVDFANKFIGGGFLGKGTVQEEILFAIYPELIISRLFTEKLTSCESLIVTGCERFSQYSGYASSFKFEGDFFDITSSDPKGRRCTQFVAIDALYITRPATQFHPRFLTRELNKAYVGFSSPSATAVPIATGKWGCGAFRGNSQLKAVLQLLAASQAGRDVIFFTFGDAKIQSEIEEMYETIKNCTIQQVWKLLCHYYSLFCTSPNPKYNLCEYLIRFGDDSTRTPYNSDVNNSGGWTTKKLKEVPITSFYTNESESSKLVTNFLDEEYLMSSTTTGNSNIIRPKISKPPFSKSHLEDSRTSTRKKLLKNEPLSDNQITDLLDENSQQDANFIPVRNNDEEITVISETLICNQRTAGDDSVLPICDTNHTSVRSSASSKPSSSSDSKRQTSLTDFYK